MNTALRQGAIRLACLHPDDRRWILESLQIAERDVIQEMLDEIDSLGLAADPSVVELLMREPPMLKLREPVNSFGRDIDPFWLALADKAAHKNQGILREEAIYGKWRAMLGEEPVPAALGAQLSVLMNRGVDNDRA